MAYFHVFQSTRLVAYSQNQHIIKLSFGQYSYQDNIMFRAYFWHTESTG